MDFVQAYLTIWLMVGVLVVARAIVVPMMRLYEARVADAQDAQQADEALLGDLLSDDITSSDEPQGWSDILSSLVPADQEAEDDEDGRTDDGDDAQRSEALLWLLGQLRAGGATRDEARPYLALLGIRFKNALWTQAGQQGQPAEGETERLVAAPWSGRMIDPANYLASALPAVAASLSEVASDVPEDDKEGCDVDRGAATPCHAAC